MPHSPFPPRHIAIVMDGNGRWASRRSMPRATGHRRGAKATRAVVEAAGEHDVEALTLFAFSSENWQRPSGEVRILMDLFGRTIRRELAELRDNGVRLRFIGARERFSAALQRDMVQAEADTATNTRLNLQVAVDYGGRWDIVEAARACARKVAAGTLDPDQLDESVFAQQLSLAALPPPDLLIRTGGERRISNFLLWDMAYTEMYFCDTLWPDFDAQALGAAIDWFMGRERRFGRVGIGG